MEKRPINPETISIVPAREDDLSSILNLFDEAIAWLNQRGITKQWGTEPISGSSRSQAQFMGWIDRGDMFVAHLDGRVVGSLSGCSLIYCQPLGALPCLCFLSGGVCHRAYTQGVGYWARLLAMGRAIYTGGRQNDYLARLLGRECCPGALLPADGFCPSRGIRD